jgi:hypothetical protein
MRIAVADLRAIADRLFNYLEESERESFEVAEDYYWEIPKEDLYEPAKDPDPKDFGIGQLSHDWERLEEILKGESPPIGYALVWYSAILRLIGEKAVY